MFGEKGECTLEYADELQKLKKEPFTPMDEKTTMGEKTRVDAKLEYRLDIAKMQDFDKGTHWATAPSRQTPRCRVNGNSDQDARGGSPSTRPWVTRSSSTQ